MLPRDINTISDISPQIKLTSSLMNKLRDACSKRTSMALELSGYEFTNVPECLYDPNKNKPFKNKKSSLKDMLSKDSPGVAFNLFEDQYESKSLVVDLSTVIRSFGPRYKDRTDVTFEDFISVIIDHILQIRSGCRFI